MKLHKPTTRTVVELAPEPQEERVVFNASDRVVEASDDSAAIPALIRTSGGDPVPALEPVQRVMKRVELPLKTPRRVELSSPQPATEVDVAAEPVSGGELVEEEQTAIQEELQNEQASDRPVLSRVPRRQVIELPGSVLGEQDTGNDTQGVDDTVGESESAGTIPTLEPVQKSEETIPALVVVRDGGALPEGLSEIPKLEEYNKMEVAHLLIGRSVEDEEVVLLQSFSERFIRSKKPEEFQRVLQDRVTGHISNLTRNQVYDFLERASNRHLSVLPVNAALQTRGVEWMGALLDNGEPTVIEIQEYAEANSITTAEAIEEMREQGVFVDQSYVFTWALVKIKIGHDFGSYKLSDLMPTL